MALVLTIGGYDRTSLLVHESLSISQTNDGLNSTCEFDLIDKDVVLEDIWTVEHSIIEGPDRIYLGYYPDTKVEVYVDDGAMRYFGGILSRVTISHLGTTSALSYDEARVFHCACHDFNQMIEESVVDEPETYGATLDNAIIHDIFNKYVTGVGHIAHVAGGAYVFDEITFDDITVRQLLDTICAQSECIWYVDYYKELHYALIEANILDWWLSDQPNNIDSFEYFDEITKEVDSTNLVNQVFVVGGPVALWFVDATSIAQYGEHKAIVRDTSLIDIDDIEAYGDGILAKYKNPIASYTLTTYRNEDDLRAGKHIRLICALYGIDKTLLINSLTITFPADGSPEYNLVLGGIESSMSASAKRLTLDKIHNSTLPIRPSQLVLSSRGWGHDLVFTADDHNTVEWTGGDITTAAGDAYAIIAGDTGNMVGKTIVYLDLDISVAVLQTTDDELDAIGANRIMIAVCWLGTPAAGPVLEVKAGFQVFGTSSDGDQTYLNADNIAADCIIANHIAANTVTAAQVAAHTLTGDQMGFITLGANTIVRTAPSPAVRIEMNATFLAGYSDAVTKQFYLDAATGKAFAGAGEVMLDTDGITILQGELDRNKVLWTDGVTEFGQVYAHEVAGGEAIILLKSGPSTLAADESRVQLQAIAAGAAADAIMHLYSGRVGAEGFAHFRIENGFRLKITKDYVLAYQDLRAGGTIRTDAAHDWDLGSYVATPVVSTGYVEVEIDGFDYKLLARL